MEDQWGERDGEPVWVEEADSVDVWVEHFVEKADEETETRGDALDNSVTLTEGVD